MIFCGEVNLDCLHVDSALVGPGTIHCTFVTEHEAATYRSHGHCLLVREVCVDPRRVALYESMTLLCWTRKGTESKNAPISGGGPTATVA